MELTYKQAKSLIKYAKDMGVRELEAGGLRVVFDIQFPDLVESGKTRTNEAEANGHDDILDVWSAS
jgi:hypothetical protein